MQYLLQRAYVCVQSLRSLILSRSSRVSWSVVSSTTAPRPWDYPFPPSGRQHESDIIASVALDGVAIMPRYYFHVRRGRVTILDEGVIELADALEAAKEAVRRALQIEADAVMKDFARSNGAIIVDDEFSTVLEVPFEGPRAALAAEPGSVAATGR